MSGVSPPIRHSFQYIQNIMSKPPKDSSALRNETLSNFSESEIEDVMPSPAPTPQKTSYQNPDQLRDNSDAIAIIDSSAHSSVEWSVILDLFENGDDAPLFRYLKMSKSRICLLRDDKGFTLLHHAVLKVKIKKLQILYDFAQVNQKEDI